MIDWLLKLSGRCNTHNMEKNELIGLRKEMIRLKHKYKQDEEAEVISEPDEDLNSEQDDIDNIIYGKRSVLQNRGHRGSVCAEVYGVFNKKVEFKPRVISKSQDQFDLFKDIIKNNFLFNCLDEADMNTVILAMEQIEIPKGNIVIKQKDSGDTLYLVEKGELDCYKSFDDREEKIYLKTYYPGDSFGELALLYNAPRQATIIAKENSKLLALDRETFNHIVKDSAIRKRERYENFLKSVHILNYVQHYEISLIAEALKLEKFSQGDYIIKINDEGDKFYILEEGYAYASKTLEQAEDQNVKDYGPGDYFGELALIRNDKRAANVIAKVKFNF